MNCADFTNDGALIAAGFKDGTIMLWVLDSELQIDITGKANTNL